MITLHQGGKPSCLYFIQQVPISQEYDELTIEILRKFLLFCVLIIKIQSGFKFAPADELS